MPYQMEEHHQRVKDKGLCPGDIVVHQYSGIDHLFLVTDVRTGTDISVVSLASGRVRSLPTKDLELFRGRAKIYNVLD